LSRPQFDIPGCAVLTTLFLLTSTASAASTATLLSWAPLGPFGFFAHNFVRGRDVSIDTKKTFTVFTDHDVYIKDAVTGADSDRYAPQ